MANREIMMDALSSLLNLVEEEINPQQLTKKSLTTELLQGWQDLLVNNTRTLKQGYLLERPEYAAEKLYFLDQVTSLSNTLQSYLFRYRAAWTTSQAAESIRAFYIATRNILESLIEALLKTGEHQSLELPISNFSLANVTIDLKVKCRQLVHYLEISSADPELIRLLMNNLYALLRKRHFSYRDAEYMEGLCGAILQTADLDTRRLRELLFAWNFNSPEFFMYWVNGWQRQLIAVDGLHEQLETITLEQDKINTLQSKARVRMLPGEVSLKADLQHFLGEKGQLVSQLIKLRRIVLKDNELAKSAARLRINLPVTQFGLFIRLQIESGLLPKENVGQVFTFFATHYSAKQALFISAESLQKKSTDVEHLTAQKMKGHLIWMINWINEHFSATD
jgi:hypothetical protein